MAICPHTCTIYHTHAGQLDPYQQVIYTSSLDSAQWRCEVCFITHVIICIYSYVVWYCIGHNEESVMDIMWAETSTDYRELHSMHAKSSRRAGCEWRSTWRMTYRHAATMLYINTYQHLVFFRAGRMTAKRLTCIDRFEVMSWKSSIQKTTYGKISNRMRTHQQNHLTAPFNFFITQFSVCVLRAIYTAKLTYTGSKWVTIEKVN